MDELTRQNLDRLGRLMALDEKPVLFTGAGFSYGAKNVRGIEMPLGNRLKEMLVSDLLCLDKDSVDGRKLMGYPLSKVYQFCYNNYGDRAGNFLCDIFTDCVPEDFQNTIANFPWRRIYTLNIDDLLEKAVPMGRLNLLNSKVPRTPANPKGIEYVKLHGCVSNFSEGFVFSDAEYVARMAGSLDWRYARLIEDMRTRTMVFIGATGDEVDIDYYLSIAGQSPDEPRGNFYYVDPNPDMITVDRITTRKANLIRMTAEEFAAWMKSTVGIPNVSARTIIDANFKRNFRNVSSTIKAQGDRKVYDTSLYYGEQPHWVDIANGFDFRTLCEEKILTEIEKMLSAGKENIVATLVSKAIGGKSVSLKRIGAELSAKGYDVYEFVGRKFNWRNFMDVAASLRNDTVVLLMDDASGYYDAVAKLVEKFPRRKRLVAVLSARPYYHYKCRYDLRHFSGFVEYGVDNTTNEEIEYRADSAVAILDRKGLLGALKGLDREAQIKHFVRNRDLPDALWQVFHGQSIRDRFRNAYRQVLVLLNDRGSKDPDLLHLVRETLLLLALFSKRELPYVPDTLLSFLCKGSLRKVRGMIGDLVRETGGYGISLRTDILTDIIINEATIPEKMEAVRDCLRIIAPYLGDRDGNWNQIQSRIMNVRFLGKLSIPDRKIKELFNKLLDCYNQDYCYFIQLGIIEQQMGKYDLALNHLQQAHSFAPGSYNVENAIARNYLKQSYDDSNMERADAAEAYATGHRLMLELIAEREKYQVRAYSVHSLVKESVRYWEKWNLLPEKEELNTIFSALRQVQDTFPDDLRINNASKSLMKFVKTHKLEKFLPDLKFSDLSIAKGLFSEEETAELLEDEEP